MQFIGKSSYLEDGMMRIVAKHNEGNIPTNESLVHLGQLFWHVIAGPGRVWGGGEVEVEEGGRSEGGSLGW